MSKEQIEEMARDIYDAENGHYDISIICGYEELAEYLYNAGYRKQSEGTWIWTENGEADHEKYWVCSVCKEHDFVRTKYCPECGAHMKGGAK